MRHPAREFRFRLPAIFGRSARRRQSAGRRSLHVESLENRAMLTTLFVTDAGDAGAGTFRDAVAEANSDSSVSAIVFDGVGTVSIDSSVEYTGGQSLSIDGDGATIEATTDGAYDLFVSSGGADLKLSSLSFQDGANGIFVPVPADTTGMLAVSLDDVTVQGSGLFGLHISDQENNSDAGVRLNISSSTFTGNGVGELDFDGIRVDEGGAGNIIVNVVNTTVDANGGDGLELDERGDGNVRLNVKDSSFNENGFFDEEDLDDGLDIDEAGEGGIWVKVVNSTFNGNFDEGFDLDEEDGGSVNVSFVNVAANNNIDEGIKIGEEDGGNVSVDFRNVEASGSIGEEGIVIEEEGAGNLIARLRNVIANGNDKEGIEIVEEGDGNLHVNLRNVTANGNDDDGIQIEEADNGNLSVVAMGVTANNNDKFGLKVEQEDDGEGSLVLGDADLDDNDDGELDTDGVIVTEV